MGIRGLGLAGVLALLMASRGAATPLTVGSPDGSNCFPFICYAETPYAGLGAEYQAVYAATAFPGPITVENVDFFAQTSGLVEPAELQIAFYTTSSPVGGLDPTYADNLGALLESWDIRVGGELTTRLSFVAPTPFVYDPSVGNLLMQVTVVGVGRVTGYEADLEADYTGVEASSLSGAGASGYPGLGAPDITFNVPEPGAWALMLAGTAALGGALRARRRRASGAQAIL